MYIKYVNSELAEEITQQYKKDTKIKIMFLSFDKKSTLLFDWNNFVLLKFYLEARLNALFTHPHRMHLHTVLSFCNDLGHCAPERCPKSLSLLAAMNSTR
jgi:hypothetical protein